MKDQLAEHAKDYLTLALTGLGITFAPHEYIGGLFLALAGAAFAMKADPEQDRRELWVVLLGAFLAAHVAVIVMQLYWPDFPPQIVMALTGYGSRPITRATMRFLGLIEARSDTLFDRVVDKYLPDDDRRDD